MNLLAPETYEGVRRPLLEAETLPPQCYTSREFYKLEVANIFMKCWNIIGREDYLKKPGDFFAFTIVEIPVFAVKAEDGRIRAFINSCRHRGARLLEDEGNCRGIVCPYHAWTYDLQGRLRGATGMADTIGFNAADFGLIEIKVDTWAGFLFVNFDPQSVSLKQYLGRLHEFTNSYSLDSMVTTYRKSFKLRTNWKSYVENSQEVFHLPTIHRRTFGTLKAEFTHTNGAPGNFTIQGTRLTNPKPRSVVEGAASFDRIPTLTGAAAQGAQYILVYPCTIIGCDLDFMWFRSTEPEGPGSHPLQGGFLLSEGDRRESRLQRDRSELLQPRRSGDRRRQFRGRDAIRGPEISRSAARVGSPRGSRSCTPSTTGYWIACSGRNPLCACRSKHHRSSPHDRHVSLRHGFTMRPAGRARETCCRSRLGGADVRRFRRIPGSR